jgi:hypothetical protein
MAVKRSSCKGGAALARHMALPDIFRFINREMTLSGLPALTRPVHCTMKYRALDLGGMRGPIQLVSACRFHD